MTTGANFLNDFPENQLTKFQLGGRNVTILHTFAALFQYHLSTAKNGTFGVPGRPRPGRGTMKPKYGTCREIRKVGNPNGECPSQLGIGSGKDIPSSGTILYFSVKILSFIGAS